MHKPGSFIEFHDGQNQAKEPFIMYADFKEILRQVDGSILNPNESFTREVNHHIPSVFCVYSKFSYVEVEAPLKLYRGKDCIEQFCNYIKEQMRRLYHMFPEKTMKPEPSKEC